MTELARLDALYAAATPGEWEAVRDGEVLSIAASNDCPICDFGSLNADDYPAYVTKRLLADHELIAALHNAYPALRSQLREMAAEIERYKIWWQEYKAEVLVRGEKIEELEDRIDAVSAELDDYRDKYLLLGKQHARLCDQVYEEDGETLKLAAAESRLAELERERDALRAELNELEPPVWP